MSTDFIADEIEAGIDADVAIVAKAKKRIKELKDTEKDLETIDDAITDAARLRHEHVRVKKDKVTEELTELTGKPVKANKSKDLIDELEERVDKRTKNKGDKDKDEKPKPKDDDSKKKDKAPKAKPDDEEPKPKDKKAKKADPPAPPKHNFRFWKGGWAWQQWVGAVIGLLVGLVIATIGILLIMLTHVLWVEIVFSVFWGLGWILIGFFVGAANGFRKTSVYKDWVAASAPKPKKSKK